MVKQSHYKKRFTQKNFTRSILETIGWSIGRYSDLYKIIWDNPVSDESLRVSLSGLAFLKKNGFKFYEFPIHTALTARNLVQLQRFFPSPYAYVQKRFVVFDEQEASMLTLYGDDIQQYLDSIEQVS